MDNELRLMVGDDEKIIYAGKPNKKCFIFESIFNPLLPFALIWGIIDFGVIGFSMTSKDEKAVFFLVPFMLLHLMPVWIYLGGALLSFRRYQNTSYIVTDKAIYASGGVFSRHYNTKPFAELSHEAERPHFFPVELENGLVRGIFGTDHFFKIIIDDLGR